MTVSRFSTIRVLRNIYSVPARLIGRTLTVRVRAETLELYLGVTRLDTLPRLRGQQHHRIDYRHVIESLVRKPGAFAHYRYRDELFPSLIFRRADDALRQRVPQRADQHYLRVLQLAAGTSEADVEAALSLLLEAGAPPTVETVRDVVRGPEAIPAPLLACPPVDLAVYDQLLLGGRGV